MCKYLNAYAKCQSTNREIKTAKCLLLNEIAKFSFAKFYRVKFSSAKFSRPTVYIYIYIYVYICQDGGAVGFVDFTKLLFALSSLAQPLKRVRSIPEHFFVILSQCKACAGRFREETAGKRTGPITRWPLRRLLFTQLEIVFVTISLFIKRTKVAHKVFQEELCCL